MISKIKSKLIYIYNFTIDKFLYYFYRKPNILDINKTIDKITTNKCSVCRFGDGELFLLAETKGFEFQKINSKLSIRLKSILSSDLDNLMVGIPNVFTNSHLEKRTLDSKSWWKQHLIYNRKLWYKYISFNKTYIDSTFTRNYMGIKDKSHSDQYFKNIKNIWDGRDVVIVEGEYSRLGVNNDLLDNTKSLIRILAPSKNAFDKYDEIFNKVTDIVKGYEDKLILISLGPTATVLAYDLHKLGYQAIDIGHIDIEYEWFKNKMNKKSPIKNKNVYEASNLIDCDNFYNDLYEKQIVGRVH